MAGAAAYTVSEEAYTAGTVAYMPHSENKAQTKTKLDKNDFAIDIDIFFPVLRQRTHSAQTKIMNTEFPEKFPANVQLFLFKAPGYCSTLPSGVSLLREVQ